MDVVNEMEKGWNEKIIFGVSEFKGKSYANIRIFYEDDEGEWKPTKKGISINIESFAEFKECVDQLEQYLTEKGYV